MTRKQAILLGISILEKNKKNAEITQKLQEILEEYPNKTWTKKEVFDAVEQFRIDHNGRYPNVKEFKNKCLPSHSSIKNLFDMTVTDFLNFYYPERIQQSAFRYKNKSTYYWIDQFKQTYLLINNGKHVTEDVYNKCRQKSSPCTQTLMKMLGVNTYKELLKLSGLDRPKLVINIKHNRKK